MISKSEENEIMWESLKTDSSQDHLSLLMDSKHMIEHMIKTINNYSMFHSTPDKPKPKFPNMGEISSAHRNVKRIYESMGVDVNEKPVI